MDFVSSETKTKLMKKEGIKFTESRLYWLLFVVKRFCRPKRANRRRMSSEINLDALRCGWMVDFSIAVVFEMRALFVSDHIEMRIVVELGDFSAIGVQLVQCADVQWKEVVNCTWTIEILWQRECGCIIGFKDSANKIASHSSVQVFMMRLNWESIIELHFSMTLFRCSTPIIRNLFPVACHAAIQCLCLTVCLCKRWSKSFPFRWQTLSASCMPKTATSKYACEQEFGDKLPRILLIFHLSRGGGGCHLSPSDDAKIKPQHKSKETRTWTEFNRTHRRWRT